MTKKDFFVVIRGIFKHWTFQEAPDWVFKLWMLLIGHAAWENRFYSHWRMSIPLRRGQVIYTVTELGNILKQDKRRISDWLDKFCSQGMILIEYIVKDSSKSLNSRTGSKTAGETGHITEQRTGFRIVSRTETPDYRTILGLLITICNYDKYQLESGSRGMTEERDERTRSRTGKRTESRTDERTVGGTGGRTINNTEDEKGRRDKNIIREKESHSPSKDNSLTPETATQIWNELRGPLPEVTTGYAKETQDELAKLAAHFNRIAANGQSPGALFGEFVTKAARTTHPEHYSTVRLIWLAKKPSRIDQVNDGVFAKSYNKSGDENGRASNRKSTNKGSLESYRSKEEEGGGGGFRIDPPTNV